MGRKKDYDFPDPDTWYGRGRWDQAFQDGLDRAWGYSPDGPAPRSPRGGGYGPGGGAASEVSATINYEINTKDGLTPDELKGVMSSERLGYGEKMTYSEIMQLGYRTLDRARFASFKDKFEEGKSVATGEVAGTLFGYLDDDGDGKVKRRREVA